jgi:hypothetical protein
LQINEKRNKRIKSRRLTVVTTRQVTIHTAVIDSITCLSFSKIYTEEECRNAPVGFTFLSFCVLSDSFNGERYPNSNHIAPLFVFFLEGRVVERRRTASFLALGMVLSPQKFKRGGLLPNERTPHPT